MTRIPDEVEVIQLSSDSLDVDKSDSLRFIKEHIYAGTFTQGGKQFTVSEDAIDWIASESQRFIDDGNKSNVPVEHTDDPRDNTGHNLRWFARKDSKGRHGLFSEMEFASAKDAKLAKTAQTSIKCPKQYEVAGKVYTRPVIHTALTDYPRIPGLDKFETIVASLTEPRKVVKMKILDLLNTDFDLQLSGDGVTEDAVAKKLKTVFEEKESSLKKLQEDLELSQKRERELKEQIPEKKDPIVVTEGQRDMLKENVELKLSSLVEKNKITPACKDRLMGTFGDDETLNLRLSQETSRDSRIFKEMISALEENDAIKLHEMTGPQVDDENDIWSLSKRGEKDKEPDLVTRMKEKAKAAGVA